MFRDHKEIVRMRSNIEENNSRCPDPFEIQSSVRFLHAPRVSCVWTHLHWMFMNYFSLNLPIFLF